MTFVDLHFQWHHLWHTICEQTLSRNCGKKRLTSLFSRHTTFWVGVSPIYTNLLVFSSFSSMYPLCHSFVCSSPACHNCMYGTTYSKRVISHHDGLFMMGNHQSSAWMIDTPALQNGVLTLPDIPPCDFIQPYAPS